MEIAKVTEAQESLRELFIKINIQRVVFVDDAFKVDYEQASGFFTTADIELLKQIDELKLFAFTDDKDVNLSNFRTLWDSLTDSERCSLFIRLPRPLSTPEPSKMEENRTAQLLEDPIVIPVLDEVFKGIRGVDFKELSLTKWKEVSSNLIDEAKTIKSIFFFDQDLSKDGGSDKEGIKQIQYTLAKAKADKTHVMCSLLSHTFSPEQAYDGWKTFAKEQDIDESQFILVSKSEINNLPSFIHMIKLMILNQPCSELISGVSEAIRTSHEESLKKIKEINIFDFDNIVFRSSRHEGVWELDTLIRLFSIFQRDKIRETVKSDGTLNSLLSEIRDISRIRSAPSALYSGNSWKIQRSEIYEDAAHLNSLHLQLELGDIFQNSNSSKTYILLAQPCDLMIRSQGETPGERRPDVRMANLAEIVPDKPDQGDYYELPFFLEKDPWYVKFTATHPEKLLVLDMCVFQDDGASKFITNQQCPSNVIPAWQLHHNKVRDDVNKEMRVYLDLKNKVNNQQLIYLLFKSAIGLFIPCIDDSIKGKETLTYSCKRIGRLCEPRASAMLTAYANHVCRAAFEHDFGGLPES